MSKRQFKAESKRLLDLMINSIYTHKEIFLREIISNASDAIDKLCFKSLTDEGVGMTRADFKINVEIDEENRLITVTDNGIGMTKDELESNLGVIARSGSLSFKQELDGEEAEKADIDIIGQFGVGFYSAFMVSDKVTVVSRAYGAEAGCQWESSGADGYTISDCDKPKVGTSVVMHLKPDTDDEKYSEFLGTWKIRGLIKKYSDYVRWPIIMDTEKSVPREGAEGEFDTVTEPETVNSMVPMWQRSKTDATDEDCMAFYKEKYYDTKDPVKVIRVNAEGTMSYRAMLFVPEQAPYNFYMADAEYGLTLYSSGVMIMEKCKELLPECFRFVRGVVDSPDLSLNISREMLQHDRQLKVIASSLEKKIKSELKKLMDEEPEKYEAFYKSFGLQLKYGALSDYGARKELLQELFMFYSSTEKELTPLSEYAKKMPEEQKYIYYVCAESVSRADSLPQTELLREKGFEILYMTERVDEFLMQALREYDGKEFRSITTDDLGLETDEEKKDVEAKQERDKALLDFIKDSLAEKVSSVKLTGKLKSHPVCLSTEGSVTMEMEKYFATLPDQGMGAVKAQRVLELNPEHPAYAAVEKAFEENREKAAKLAEILLCQAMLIADVPLENPSAYTDLICELF